MIAMHNSWFVIFFFKWSNGLFIQKKYLFIYLAALGLSCNLQDF